MVQYKNLQYTKLINRHIIYLIILLIAIFISVLIDLTTGPSGLTLSDILRALFKPEQVPMGMRVTIWDIRLPGALMALVVGMSLGLAGAEMQTTLHNPLASPFTLGVSSAACFGAALAIVLEINFFGVTPQWVISVNALFFALLVSLLLYVVSRKLQLSSGGIILFGVALVFTFNSLVSLMQFMSNETNLQTLVFWTMGSLGRTSWEKLGIISLVLLVVLLISLLNSWKLTALALGEDRATSFGINVHRLKLSTILRTSIISALSVVFVGPIGFIGLVSPHIARAIFGQNHYFYLPASALIGALILSLASFASKNIVSGVIIPIGIVTALIGIPFFLSIVLRNAGKI